MVQVQNPTLQRQQDQQADLEVRTSNLYSMRDRSKIGKGKQSNKKDDEDKVQSEVGNDNASEIDNDDLEL